MSMEVSLTVGKLDASLALLTTQSHHVIEFPTVLLPDSVKAGSIVKIQVTEDFEQEAKERARFKKIQDEILAKYGSREPAHPVLRLVNVTQTSCVLEWDALDVGSSQLTSLVLFKQGVRALNIPNPINTTSTKVSGLSIDTDYEFQLKMSTTAGKLLSNTLKVHTHKMTDMSGITVCLGKLEESAGITKKHIESSLKAIGAKPLQKKVSLDTTHFICNDVQKEDEELERAKNGNIPIVRPEWLKACELEKRIVGVRGFYLDVDASTLESYGFSKTAALKKASTVDLPQARESSNVAENGSVAEEKLDEVALSADDKTEENVSEAAPQHQERTDGQRLRPEVPVAAVDINPEQKPVRGMGEASEESIATPSNEEEKAEGNAIFQKDEALQTPKEEPDATSSSAAKSLDEAAGSCVIDKENAAKTAEDNLEQNNEAAQEPAIPISKEEDGAAPKLDTAAEEKKPQDSNEDDITFAKESQPVSTPHQLAGTEVEDNNEGEEEEEDAEDAEETEETEEIEGDSELVSADAEEHNPTVANVQPQPTKSKKKKNKKKKGRK